MSIVGFKLQLDEAAFLEAGVLVADFLAVVAKEKDKANVEQLAAVLKKHRGNDHVTAVATPVERGVKYRLELEEGVLRVLSELHALKEKR